jgi:hypothetical protein
MSITTIARQAQGMRAGEVIAKLAEDAYFMRVNNGVTHAPRLRSREADHEATSRSPADNGRNRTRGELPQNPNRARASSGGPSQGGHSAGRAGGSRAVVAHGDAGGGGSSGGSSSHGAGRRAGGRGDREGRGHAATSPMSHAAATMPVAKSRKFDAGNPPGQARTTASPPSLLDFAICGSRRNSSLWGLPSTVRSKTQYSGSGATPSPSRTLVATTTQSAYTSLSA